MEQNNAPPGPWCNTRSQMQEKKKKRLVQSTAIVQVRINTGYLCLYSTLLHSSEIKCQAKDVVIDVLYYFMH